MWWKLSVFSICYENYEYFQYVMKMISIFNMLWKSKTDFLGKVLLLTVVGERFIWQQPLELQLIGDKLEASHLLDTYTCQ